jgi:arginase
MRKLQIIHAPSDLGAGKRGAGLGAQALFLSHADIYLKTAIIKTHTQEKVLVEKQKKPAKYPEAIYACADDLATAVQKTLAQQDFPLVFSGDHSNAIGTLAGIKRAYPDKKLGVIWIDAHADIHSFYTTPSGNLHGMPLAMALGLDHAHLQCNTLTQSQTDLWEQFKRLAGVSPMLRPEDLVFVGIRDLEKEEWQVLQEQNIKYISVAEARKAGLSALAKTVQNDLNHCDMLYISWDVDSLDPSFSKGTGTPVPDGFYPEEVQTFLQYFWQDPKLIALEVTEINPLLDKENQMAEIAHGVLLPLLTSVSEKKYKVA